MDDEKIIKNMKEVLKKTRKSKHKKPRSQDSNDGDDSISEILNKNWNFRSPQAQEKQPDVESLDAPSPKVNIFARMMAKKPEPLTQLSPEVNGIKKKRKYVKKVKNIKAEDKESDDSMSDDENTESSFKNCNSPVKGIQKFLTTKAKESPVKVKSRGSFEEVDRSDEEVNGNAKETNKSAKEINGTSKKVNGSVNEVTGNSTEVNGSCKKINGSSKKGRRPGAKLDKIETKVAENSVNLRKKSVNLEENSIKIDENLIKEEKSSFKPRENSIKLKENSRNPEEISEENSVNLEENSVKIHENIIEGPENNQEIPQLDELSQQEDEQFSIIPTTVEDISEFSETSRKRNRDISENLEKTPKMKKRKTRGEKTLLDSNENSVEFEVNTPTYSSGRPRRSCAGNVNYEMLISPEKIEKKPSQETPKRSSRARNVKKSNDEDFEVFEVEDDSPVKPKKLAPVFVKKLPKPVIDPAVKEARRNFLLSGLPEDLRNNIDKQKQFENEILGNELVAFPLVSHVTQLKGVEEVVEDLIGKSKVRIRKDDDEDRERERRVLVRGMLTNCKADDENDAKIELKPLEPVKSIKEKVKKLKIEYEDFPTNRVFKLLHKKHNHQQPDDENILFVDIFKPASFEEFHVSTKPVKALHKFFHTWNDKTDDYDSDDSNSRQSSRGMSNNFVVLSGPNGTGKTCSVYAIAKDLNYQVIEINAGSRRSGKKMLQDLLEATQSHRVKNGDSENSLESDGKSIILIEDAELAFESDDGFAASIQQLINISKRPVVLTTNSRNCQHLQKFIVHNEIVFDPGAHNIGKYLSLLCLAANYQITPAAIEHLYALNGRDLRKTINEIEFFIRSGATTNDGNLVEFYRLPPTRREGQRDSSNKTLSSVRFESSIGSSFAVRMVNDDETSYQQRDLMNEMREYLATRCNAVEIQRDLTEGKQKIIESSISSDLISQSTNIASLRTLAMDYSPLLRNICRSEKMRCESGRRTTTNNRGHYLRFIQNSFGNDYFNEQCEIFRRQ